MLNKLFDYVDQSQNRVVELQSAMTSIIAMGPENGGDGEQNKAEYLLTVLKTLGITDIQVFNAPDTRVSNQTRPNIIAKISANSLSTANPSSENNDPTLWVIGHMDVVPAGELSLWNSDPFSVSVDGDYIIGRGVEDNQQAITSSLIAAEALLKVHSASEPNSICPNYNLGLIFVADEETGNKYGMQFLLEKHPEIFKADDLILVPDYGNKEGTAIEISEKAQLWLKVTVLGQQCHASTPGKGINSLQAAAACILAVDEMHNEFEESDELFNPPFSTFVPTKKEANVDNINTMPGKDVFYIDCRIIPGISIDEVLETMSTLLERAAAKHGASMSLEVVQLAPQTPAVSLKSKFLKQLSEAVYQVYGVNPKAVGIGGGTVAGLLRGQGHEALVWSKLIPNAHVPNEKSRISCNLGDAKVILQLLFQDRN